MIEFIRAEELKRKFGVFGHFYSVQVAPKQLVECRSVLEIVESEYAPKKSAALSGRTPDAVFVMMNPGSSRPLAAVDNRIRVAAIHELAVSLVPAKPDTTQYQVMRLMHHCGWRHVRVLNLSDLRCPKSGVFFKQFRGLEEDHSFDAHSVFSDRRADELALKLLAGVPVVCAWGVSPHLDPLIDRCRAKLAGATAVRGLRKEGTTNKFLHPLPSLQSQQAEWISRMVEQCRA
jgi:hypothetical protein